MMYEMQEFWKRTSTVAARSIAIIAAVVLLTSSESRAAPATNLTLAAGGPSTGLHALTGQDGTVQITLLHNGHTRLRFSLSGLTPNSVNSAWLIFDTSQAPFSGAGATLAATDTATGTNAPVFPSSPAASDNAGFKDGNGLDPNGFVSDKRGNAKFQIDINYDITQPAAAPVVVRGGMTQVVVEMDSSGDCVQSGSFSLPEASGYMRTYDLTGVPPYFEQTTGPLSPKLVRGKVASFMLVEHLDGLTHGYVSGQPFGSASTAPPGSACGNWVPRLVGNLSDAH